jgi:hypothetical protein
MSSLRNCPAVLLVGVLCLSITGTAGAGAQTAAPVPQPAAPAASPKLVPGSFIDVTDKVGVKFQHQALHTSRKYLLETMGSGVALLDCDNDGRLDIFLVNGAPYTDPTPAGYIPKTAGPEH